MLTPNKGEQNLVMGKKNNVDINDFFVSQSAQTLRSFLNNGNNVIISWEEKKYLRDRKVWVM